MDAKRLDGILDNGWNSTKEDWIVTALGYLAKFDAAKVIPQTKNITGSGGGSSRTLLMHTLLLLKQVQKLYLS